MHGRYSLCKTRTTTIQTDSTNDTLLTLNCPILDETSFISYLFHVQKKNKQEYDKGKSKEQDINHVHLRRDTLAAITSLDP